MAGVDYILICSNTGNECVERIQKELTVPVIHIADVIGKECRKKGFKTVGLLGTIYTMEEDYIKKILIHKYKLRVLIPDRIGRKKVNSIIYGELCLGKLLADSKREYIKVIKKLHQKGADAVILGCTEIPMLIKQSDIDIPLLDSTRIHAEYAAKMSLNYKS